MRYMIFLLCVTVLVFAFPYDPKNSSKINNEKQGVTTTSFEAKPVQESKVKNEEASEQVLQNENEVVTTTSFEAKSVEESSMKNVEASKEALEFVRYAKTLIGTPYLYGSTDPKKGLDCSGFVNCVSDHFGIDLPRSSVEFTNFGKTIATENAGPGDLILFTGTDAATHVVGHIGIITENKNGQLQFIHSSSGKANGVTISGLDDHYKTRFIKVVRIFPASSL